MVYCLLNGMQIPESTYKTPLQAELRSRPYGVQNQLAALLDVTPQEVSRWANGRRPVPERYRPQIAEALGRSESVLFNDQTAHHSAGSVQREVST